MPVYALIQGTTNNPRLLPKVDINSSFFELFTVAPVIVTTFTFHFKSKGRVLDVLKNWPKRSILVTVVTDGERILGLRDLGCQDIRNFLSFLSAAKQYYGEKVLIQVLLKSCSS
ncbi:unnamed protein product [Linum tenue]|uniref:Malic enzyme N-terminal domain-containing protein n=1 Tax=Linum tenue TaxID=586396 RepID=A0AAV0ISY7_9ROSI|nr:unnamed protein product [Linum tenue]